MRGAAALIVLAAGAALAAPSVPGRYEAELCVAWEGTTLRFSDADEDVRYDVRIGARKGTR